MINKTPEARSSSKPTGSRLPISRYSSNSTGNDQRSIKSAPADLFTGQASSSSPTGSRLPTSRYSSNLPRNDRGSTQSTPENLFVHPEQKNGENSGSAQSANRARTPSVSSLGSSLSNLSWDYSNHSLGSGSSGRLNRTSRTNALSQAAGGFQVRSTRSSDFDSITMIDRSAFNEQWSADYYRKHPSVGLNTLVADGSDSVHGFACYQMKDEGDMLIYKLATAPEARRKGIGRSLMSECIERARQENATSVRLHVRQSNEPAINLYESLGFQSKGVRPGYYGDEDGISMHLPLKPENANQASSSSPSK